MAEELGFDIDYDKIKKDREKQQYLLEWHLLPVIYRPEQLLVSIGIVSNGSAAPGTYWNGNAGGVFPVD